MSDHGQPLDAPEGATDSGSLEILRVWIGDRNQRVVIRPGVWDDPFIWGMMLADLVVDLGMLYGRDDDDARQSARIRVLEGLQAELSKPTGKPTGRIVE